jgi:hypothetical protein
MLSVRDDTFPIGGEANTMKHRNLPLVEPIAVPDVFATGLARIENMGTNMRFTFYSLQRPISGDAHDMERIVVCRIVLAVEAVTAAAMSALAATDTEVLGHMTH